MSKLKVLLVDDNPSFLRSARALLAALPHVSQVDCASSGNEALGMLDAFRPDLVVTDIMMPGMSGFELIRRLRAGERRPRVLAVSLHEGAEFRAAVLRGGAEALVPKREFGAVALELFGGLAGFGHA